MPSRRSGRVAAAAEQRAWAFPQLPLPLVLHIFALLPADARLRAAEVSRGWRATAALPALWARLDLSPASGVAQPVSHALLRAAVARAGDALTALHVCWTNANTEVLCATLRASRALVELRLGDENFRSEDVRALLAAAPQLRELHGRAMCLAEEGLELLQCRPPFGPLQLSALIFGGGAALPPALTLALADARLQPGMTRLALALTDLSAPGALDPLADAVVARRGIAHLSLYSCKLTHAAPALARVLRDGALTDLQFYGGPAATFLDIGGSAVFGSALRDNSTLAVLALWSLPVAAAPVVVALLGSLVGHRSLRKLDLSATRLDDLGWLQRGCVL